MTIFNGTDGDDNLVGTSVNDVFTPLLGQDFVTGRAGLDTLYIDYSRLTSGSGVSIQSFQNNFGDPFSFAGDLGGSLDGKSNRLQFNGIEAIHAVLTGQNDSVNIDMKPFTVPGNDVQIDAGGGNDQLYADFSVFTGTTFTVDSAGTIVSSKGTFSNFEQIHLRLGDGTNTVTTQGGDDLIEAVKDGTNVISTGDGNDYISLRGGVSTIDGGSGTDSWSADFTGTAANLTFTFDGTTGAGSVSNGTTLKGIEQGYITTGSGSDTVTISGVAGFSANGGAGNDTFNRSYAGLSGSAHNATFNSDGNGAFYGAIGKEAFYGSSGSDQFSGFEHVNVTLSDSNEQANVDTRELANGATITLSGGLGFDTLNVDFSHLANTVFTEDAAGAITSNHGTFSGFEQFYIQLGSGTNTVVTQGGDHQVQAFYGVANAISTGGGNDLIQSDSGVDTIDGGAGNDRWEGYYGSGGIARTFSYDGFTGAGSLSNGTTLSGIESGQISTGAGNDSFSILHSASFGVRAGAGYDTLVFNDAGLSGLTGGALSAGFGYEGGGAMSGAVGGASISGIENATITLSDDDNVASVDGNIYASSALLNLSGGLGFDKLSAQFSNFADTNFVVDGAGNITSNHGTFASFEQFQFLLGGGTNTIVTADGNDEIRAFQGGTNTFSTGGGDDKIVTVGGVLHLDGGAGNDDWQGYLYGLAGNLTGTFDGATGSGTLSNGTTLAGMESVTLITGSGNDSFVLANNAHFNIFDGGGQDTLTRDDSGVAGEYTAVSINDNYSGGFDSNIGGSQYYGIETLNITLSDDDNKVALAFTNAGSTGAALTLDGGLGYDTLQADFARFGDLTFTVSNTNVVTNGHGNYAGFEEFDLTLGSGTHNITLGAGDDTVRLYAGDGTPQTNTIDTGAGDDYIVSGSGNDFIAGGAGTDTVYENEDSSNFTIVQDGSGGYFLTDTFLDNGNLGTDHLTGIESVKFNDQTVDLPVYGGGANDVLTGGNGDDSIFGNGGNDKLFGLDGNDVINGGTGNDTIDGGSGNDTASYFDATVGVRVNLSLTGSQNTGSAGGFDKLISIENLIGSAFTDTLIGNDADNVLTGLAGNDKLDGRGGADTMIGGLGNDVYYVDNSGDVVIENAGEGTLDVVKAKVSFTLSANIEKLILDGTDDIDGTGNDLANTIVGNAGNNHLFGIDGKDLIVAGAGDDTISGGLGADILTGGTGADHFLFDVLETAANKDTIKDFTGGVDKIEIDRSAFAAFAGEFSGALPAFELALGTKATTADQHLVYNITLGALYYDSDGSGSYAQIQIAVLAGRPTLDAGDFLLV